MIDKTDGLFAALINMSIAVSTVREVTIGHGTRDTDLTSIITIYK